MQGWGRRSLCAVAAAWLAASGGLAQAPPRQEAPAIKATSRLVQVSVVVRDKKTGAPITDLRREDFTLFDNGQPQAVAGFSFESTPAEVPVEAATLEIPNSFTNRPTGRLPAGVTVILVDILNTTAVDYAYARKGVAEFLSTLSPDHRVALYVLSRKGITVVHDFTSDPAPLIAAMGRYRTAEESRLLSAEASADTSLGLNPVSELDSLNERFEGALQLMANFYLRDRARRTSDAMVAIANHLSGVPGRKNLIWVSAGFPIAYGLDRLGPAQGSDPDLRASRERDTFFSPLEEVARAMNHTGMAIYPVDARGLIAAPPDSTFNAATPGRGMSTVSWTRANQLTFDTMRVLAERTGGRAFYNVNDVQGSIRRAVEDVRAAYVLTYYPQHNRWDGRFRKISVHVKRPGIEVRYRQGYFAMPDPVPTETDAQLAVAADFPVPSTALGLAARIDPLSGAEPNTWNLQIQVNARDLLLEERNGRWTGSLAVYLVQKSSEGAILASSNQSVDLQLERATYERLLQSGLKMNRQVSIEPGAYELRIVVRDAQSGLIGSVHIPVARLAAVSPPPVTP